MRKGLLVVLLAIFYLSVSINCQNHYPNGYYLPPVPDVLWYTQIFDHFNSSDTRTFQQRYLVYDDFYNNSTMAHKPIFFCPGGESDVFGGYQHNGFMFQFGQKLGAFMLFPEHRFYGDSLPFGPVNSYTPSNIAKLTIEQALADYVDIINYIIKEYNLPTDIPVFAFGGSYPGELAAFLRIAYPNVVAGSLASSAPVRYHPFLYDGTKSGAFYAVCTADFAKNNKDCPDMVRSAFNQINSLFSTSSGREQLSAELGLCSTIGEGADEQRLLNLWIENAFASLGMENYPYAIGDLPPFPMEYACEVMSTGLTSSNLIQNLGKTVGVWYNSSQTLTCFNISAEYYPCADITGCGGGVGDPNAMSWDYQSCTEIIANVDTNNVTDMFPPAPYNFDRLTEYCNQVWGVSPDPLLIPEKYNYTTSSRIIFSNGYLDPWFPGGVLQDVSINLIALQMEDAAHHLDLRGSDPNDPPSVVATRQIEEEIIVGWLSQVIDEKAKLVNNHPNSFDNNNNDRF